MTQSPKADHKTNSTQRRTRILKCIGQDLEVHVYVVATIIVLESIWQCLKMLLLMLVRGAEYYYWSMAHNEYFSLGLQVYSYVEREGLTWTLKTQHLYYRVVTSQNTGFFRKILAELQSTISLLNFNTKK